MVVRDLRDVRGPADPEMLAALETDLFAEFVLARSAAGLSDDTIRGDVINLEQVRDWFGRPLWEMEPQDADMYLGRVLRNAAQGTRLARAGALTTYFAFLELRHKVELHRVTGRVVECPVDEMNRPRGGKDARLRIPPTGEQMEAFFAGWRGELAECRKFAPSARNFAAARVMAAVGLRVNEVRHLDWDDVKWHLGRFGKLHVRMGKGARGSGPRERLVPLINGADRVLRWFAEDVWGLLDEDHLRPGAPLFPSERRATRVTSDCLRQALKRAAEDHLADYRGKLTPHVLRHYCASELYRGGMDLLAVQELLGHSWVATTMRYVHVHRAEIERAWLEGHRRAESRWEGLLG
nr:tyrosine-type recombinase/integrase [Streptomyces sabulosicollis]